MRDDARMFLRHTIRRKDGKSHRYWSVVENRRLRGGGTAQKTLLYLGEINDSQQAGWCKAIEAVAGNKPVQLCLFPADRQPPQAVEHVQTGQWLTMSRYTQPDPAAQLLLSLLGLQLPPQPPPKISPLAPVDHA